MLHQLRCGGVLEAIRISCAGYPSRKHFEEFFDRFGLLCPDLFAAAAASERLQDGRCALARLRARSLARSLARRQSLPGDRPVTAVLKRALLAATRSVLAALTSWAE